MMSTYLDLPAWKLVMPGFCIPVVLASLAFLTLISYLSVKRMLRGHGCGRASSVHAEGRPQKRRRKSSALEPAVFRHALEHPRHTAA